MLVHPRPASVMAPAKGPADKAAGAGEEEGRDESMKDEL